jgi:preprotein translocase subunit SecA
MPLESRMVSKAVERAQGTVEGRNFEIRKDVLKYDEMMNEQRKVIYKRRQQILDGEDLRETATEAIGNAIGRLVDSFCSGDFSESWDIPGLLDAASGYFPTRVTKEQLEQLHHDEEIEDLLAGDADELYAAKEESVGTDTLRDIERRVMLSVMDQYWREHLYEIDYLFEGIHYRQIGQLDPLAEWQREGYNMFEAMMGQIEDDFVRYVFHLQVVVDEPARPQVRNVQYSAPVDPVQGSSAIEAALAAGPPPDEGMGGGEGMAPMPMPGPAPAAAPVATDLPQQQPVKVEKTPGRNEPCFCGSGKKYKLCHGR